MLKPYIEEYTQKDGSQILKVFPKIGDTTLRYHYYYTPIEAYDLVSSMTWSINQRTGYVINNAKSLHVDVCRLNKEVSLVSSLVVNHHNHITYDNVFSNLIPASHSENAKDRLSRGYQKVANQPFIPCYQYSYDKRLSVSSEDKVLRLRRELELQENWCEFDFLVYRVGSEDILDLERTGEITAEEAVIKHVERYSANAWYILRFGLEQFLKENNIKMPKYSLDTEGYMCHHITGQRLSPFEPDCYKGLMYGGFDLRAFNLYYK